MALARSLALAVCALVLPGLAVAEPSTPVGAELPAERTLYVAPGQSLAALVRELYPDQPGQWARIREWIVDNNRHAVAQGEPGALHGDVRIRLPQASAFAREQTEQDPAGEPALRFGGRYLFVDPSQSLRELVPKVYPRARARWDAIVEAIMARNPEVFAATAADAPIGRGTRLSIPELSAASSQGPAEAARKGPPVGEVVSASGRLVAIDAAGDRRVLASGNPVRRDDTVRTGARGRAVIEMRDGERLTLRADSEVRIRQWRLPETGPGERVIELVKGGLRAVTGAIGNRDADDYRTVTPDTTLGVRGTRYAVRLCGQGECRAAGDGALPAGLYLGVDQGRVSALNEAGEARFAAGEFGYVAAATSAPQRADEGVAGVVYSEAERATIEQRSAPEEPAASAEDDDRSGWLWAIGGVALLAVAL